MSIRRVSWRVDKGNKHNMTDRNENIHHRLPDEEHRSLGCSTRTVLKVQLTLSVPDELRDDFNHWHSFFLCSPCMGKECPGAHIFTQLKQIPIRYTLSFYIGSDQTNPRCVSLMDKLRRESNDDDGQDIGEKTMYESHPWQSNFNALTNSLLCRELWCSIHTWLSEETLLSLSLRVEDQPTARNQVNRERQAILSRDQKTSPKRNSSPVEMHIAVNVRSNNQSLERTLSIVIGLCAHIDRVSSTARSLSLFYQLTKSFSRHAVRARRNACIQQWEARLERNRTESTKDPIDGNQQKFDMWQYAGEFFSLFLRTFSLPSSNIIAPFAWQNSRVAAVCVWICMCAHTHTHTHRKGFTV